MRKHKSGNIFQSYVTLFFLSTVPVIEWAGAVHDNHLLGLYGSLRKEKLLILNEWLLYPLNEAERRDVLELIEARNKVSSTIFCLLYDIGEWHENLYPHPQSDAICCRILQRLYHLGPG